jgi:hypothetical protein
MLMFLSAAVLQAVVVLISSHRGRALSVGTQNPGFQRLLQVLALQVFKSSAANGNKQNNTEGIILPSPHRLKVVHTVCGQQALRSAAHPVTLARTGFWHWRSKAWFIK